MFRRFLAAAAVVAGVGAGSARAEDKILFGPPPAWAHPATGLKAAASDSAPTRVLLLDEQAHFGPEGLAVYSESQIRLQTPQGLAGAGALTLPWDPDLGSLTVHKVHIIRDGQVIDVLAKQQFAVLRREQNLEAAVLDGMLTAALQPEDLRVGDVVDMAFTLTRLDPALKGHVQGLLLAPNAPVDDLRMTAASDKAPFHWRASEAMGVIKPGSLSGSGTSVGVALKPVQIVEPPQGAPPRFQRGRQIEISDFDSWAQVSGIMTPLFAKAAAIPPASPLQKEIARIKALSPDPKVRAQAALALVQDQVRYVALTLNDGGLVPADADSTWSRRFGDCKGKTALLLGLLDALGVPAEPALVSSTAGDGMDARLPSIQVFDHVLVRAVIGPRVYWLDGTRQGDTVIDDIVTPPFVWALPVQASGGALERLVQRPLDRPQTVALLDLDASAGLDAPAPAHAEMIVRGDAAVGLNLQISSLPAAQVEEGLRRTWTKTYGFITPKTVSAHFDPQTREERWIMDGEAAMEWRAGSGAAGRAYEADGYGLGGVADFTRSAGPHADAPFEAPFPSFDESRETIVLPYHGAGFTVEGADVDQTVAARAYLRKSRIEDGKFVMQASTRSLASEFPASEAPAAGKALKAMGDIAVYVRAPYNYVWTQQDREKVIAGEPKTQIDYENRAGAELDNGKLKDAVADAQKAIALTPTVRAYEVMAQAKARLGDFGGADADLEKARALGPNEMVFWRGAGFVALIEKKFADAIADFTHALEVSPHDAPSIENRANAEQNLRQFDKALADLNVLQDADPRDSRIRGARIGVLISMGKVSQILSEADAGVAAGPDDLAARHLRAGVLTYLGRNAEAVAEYGRIIAIKPAWGDYVARARMRGDADYAGKIADLDAASRLSPEPPEPAVTVARAQAEAQAMAYDKAAALVSELIRKAPDRGDYHALRAEYYVKGGKLDLAQADYKLARDEAKQNAALWNNVCWSQATMNVALPLALSDCDRAVALAPGQASFLDSRAFTLMRLGRLDDAIAQYDAVLKIAPALPASLYGRGLAKLGKGMKAEGQADIDAAVAVQPTVAKQFEAYGLKP